MYTEREPYLATPGTDSCWQTWSNSTVQSLHHRQNRSHAEEGWKDSSEDNKWMILQCATFSKSLNPRNFHKSVSDIRIRIRFPFESSFWISLSGCKLTILSDIQPANRIVIISAVHAYMMWSQKFRLTPVQSRFNKVRHRPDAVQSKSSPMLSSVKHPCKLSSEVTGVTFSESDSAPVPQFLNPVSSEISDLCETSDL